MIKTIIITATNEMRDPIEDTIFHVVNESG